MEILFRSAETGDFREAAALYRRAVRALRRGGIDQWDSAYPNRRILREDIVCRHMFVQTFDGRIVSAIVLNEYQPDAYTEADWSDREGRAAVIHRLCVRPDLQGRGIGRRTLLEAEKLLREKAYTSVRLDAFRENKAALRLYENSGYSLRGNAVFRKGEFALYEKLLRQEH